jgi:membrane protease YdiL (CAAX protease family)
MPLVIVGLVLYLIANLHPASDDPIKQIGFDSTRKLKDLGQGALLAAAIGIPGLGFYLFAKAIGINTTVVAANLSENWWTIPIYVAAAIENGLVEEVVMVGYLFTRWEQIDWSKWKIIGISALIRGTYHLYQGFGGFLGNIVMGAVFGWVYWRTRRVWVLVIAHALIDIVAFVGYALLADVLSWL